MIETTDTDYAADYNTYYERPIMSRYFERKICNSPKNYYFFIDLVFQRLF